MGIGLELNAHRFFDRCPLNSGVKPITLCQAGAACHDPCGEGGRHLARYRVTALPSAYDVAANTAFSYAHYYIGS